MMTAFENRNYLFAILDGEPNVRILQNNVTLE